MREHKDSIRIYRDGCGNWVVLRCANGLPVCGLVIPLGAETTVRGDALPLFDDAHEPDPRSFALSPRQAARWSLGREPLLDAEWPGGRCSRNVAGEGASGYISTWQAAEQDS